VGPRFANAGTISIGCLPAPSKAPSSSSHSCQESGRAPAPAAAPEDRAARGGGSGPLAGETCHGAKNGLAARRAARWAGPGWSDGNVDP
jgi:hypothetical protein